MEKKKKVIFFRKTGVICNLIICVISVVPPIFSFLNFTYGFSVFRRFVHSRSTVQWMSYQLLHCHCLVYFSITLTYVHCGNCGKRDFFKIRHFYSFLLFTKNNFTNSWSYFTVRFFFFPIKKNRFEILNLNSFLNCNLFLML